MNKTILILIALAIVLAITDIVLCCHQRTPQTIIEHDTIWRDTTIYQPLPAETINTGRVVYIKVPVSTGSTTVYDTIHDSIEVPIPIYQKRYDDSLYTAWVSGYEPNLDSIRLHQREIVTTITKYVERPASRIAIGPSVGLGYGVYQHQPDVYVGVTATWNLWRK